MTDVIVTWPKSKPLSTYLIELANAKENNLVINYRVRNPPEPTPERCYLVHDGVIVGWNAVINIKFRKANEVARVESDAFAGFWPAGWYIARRPEFHQPKLKTVKMKGFRGWRWFSREIVGDRNGS